MTEIEQECVRRIAEAKGLPVSDLNGDTPLDAIGVDSLDRVSLSFDLEEEYGIQIPETALQQIRTVGDVASAVEAAIASNQGNGQVAGRPETSSQAGAA